MCETANTQYRPRGTLYSNLSGETTASLQELSVQALEQFLTASSLLRLQKLLVPKLCSTPVWSNTAVALSCQLECQLD